LIAPVCGGAVAAFLFPQMIAAWWLLGSAGALLTAICLAAVARRLGVAASATLAIVGVLLVLACLIVVPAVAAVQQAEWKDLSPHKASLVTVEDGVQLEVLDWGGSGPAVVLLAGLGATAHQYDDLAPALAARYRVVGLTRRGHRGSSPAPAGYGSARLAEDVLRVIDAVGFNNAIVIGHSFAGEEMHVLGARHSAKIRGLVYVDAAFDRGDDSDSEAYSAVARTVPTAPTPQPADLASFTALRAYLEKHGGAWPEGYVRSRFRTNPDGSVGGLWSPDVSIRQAMTREIQAAYKPYNPERIRVPALAIYAVPKSADDLMRRGSSDRSAFPELVARAADDPAIRERVEQLYLLTRDRVHKHEQWFEAFAERGRVVELSGSHDLIVSNPREVLQQIEAFVSSLPERP
jgi:non-heme chloroperoxidase